MSKIRKYRGFTIYFDKTKNLYLVFLPDETPAAYDYPEFECESITEAMDNIDSY